MASRFPLFALNTVVFPGSRTPLHVFEDRYRAMMRDLLAVPDPADRVFGITAIREGWEVGGTTQGGGQNLHRIGCLVQLSEVERYDDGRFDIEVVGREHRFLIDEIDGSGEYPVATAQLIQPDPPDDSAELAEAAERTAATFQAYRVRLGELRGGDVFTGDLPSDPTFLSWVLAGTCLLTLDQRQELLEADTDERLAMLRHQLLDEMRAMRAVPSLPATELARMRWCPN